MATVVVVVRNACFSRLSGSGDASEDGRLKGVAIAATVIIIVIIINVDCCRVDHRSWMNIGGVLRWSWSSRFCVLFIRIVVVVRMITDVTELLLLPMMVLILCSTAILIILLVLLLKNCSYDRSTNFTHCCFCCSPNTPPVVYNSGNGLLRVFLVHFPSIKYKCIYLFMFSFLMSMLTIMFFFF